jgi:hypothetical protein
LSDEEKSKLRHEALESASKELKKNKTKKKRFNDEDLADLEDTAGEAEDWENADQYA